MTRRNFLNHAAAGALAASTVTIAKGAPARPRKGTTPLIVATWPFGQPANDVAMKTLLEGGSLLDAVEKGIRVTESDPTNSSVGLGGKPNAAGVVQLDACIMNGPDHKAGSVAALEGFRHPITAARRVMEKTKHILLVGEGARMFAEQEGLEAVESKARELHERWLRDPTPKRKGNSPPGPDNHDTIALLVLDAKGDIAGGCSTSGLGGKLPGRVGDSPIIGSGLYVDNDVGAAGATGVGENVMRFCTSFMIVEFMRQGKSPHEACVEAIRRVMRWQPKGSNPSINFIALDKKGRFGAAGTDNGFQYSVANPTGSRVLPNPGLGKFKL